MEVSNKIGNLLTRSYPRMKQDEEWNGLKPNHWGKGRKKLFEIEANLIFQQGTFSFIIFFKRQLSVSKGIKTYTCNI